MERSQDRSANAMTLTDTKTGERMRSPVLLSHLTPESSDPWNVPRTQFRPR